MLLKGIFINNERKCQKMSGMSTTTLKSQQNCCNILAPPFYKFAYLKSKLKKTALVTTLGLTLTCTVSVLFSQKVAAAICIFSGTIWNKLSRNLQCFYPLFLTVFSTGYDVTRRSDGNSLSFFLLWTFQENGKLAFHSMVSQLKAVQGQ